MKRFIAFFCALVLLTGAFSSVQAAPVGTAKVQFYDETAKMYAPEADAGIVRVTLDGSPMALDVPAVVRFMDGTDGRTLIPVRPIAEALGATVLWMPENRQVIILRDADTIVLTLGSAQAVVNGERVELPGGVPAGVAKVGKVERTLVPLRFVSEQLRAQVDWVGETYTAAITSGQTKPEPTPTAAPSSTPKPTPTAKPTPTPVPTPPAALGPEGSLLRVEADDNAQTLTLYLNAPPRYKVTDLGDRVVIDLLGFALAEGRGGELTPEDPVIKKVRFAQHDESLYKEWSCTTRVVLDLAEGCSYEKNVLVSGDPDLQAVVARTTPPETGVTPPEEPEDWDPAAFTVCLDPGHGGSASGAVYEDVMEKDITLPVTLRVAELLREKGYNVVLTRTEDVYMDLYDRCAVANAVEADVFLSIHANASATNRDFQGTFTYSYPKSAEGERLAGFVQNGVTASAGSIDRGLLTNDYVVLRETVMPAALLEMGFMTCHEELTRLIDPAYQEAVAQGAAKGVERYIATLPKKERALTDREDEPLLPPM